MNEEEFKECSVVAYPHEIRFLHIKGGHISYYVDRHVSDYVNKLQQEKKDYKYRCEKALEYLDKIETLAMSDGKIIFSINIFRNILQNEKK